MTRGAALNSDPGKAGDEKDNARVGTSTSPDWNYWRQMPDEVLWKAVALSCNIEPRRERLPDSSYWINHTRWGDARQDDRYRLFHDRLEIATARIGELDVAALSEGGTNAARINLPRFAAWAVSMQWDIPQQLADIADIATKLSKPASKSQNLATTERGTVQKIIAGFLAQGYSRDEIAKPYAIAKEIQVALQSSGLNLSDDTIVSWIKEAAPLLAVAENKSRESK
jgi:hypothetical protein